jgi:NADH-quinone oxidoreductase subunit M
VILSAVYMLWMVQRVMWGEVTRDENRSLRDLNGREWAAIGPLLILIVWMGVYSNHFLRPMDHAVTSLMQRIEDAGALHTAGGSSAAAEGRIPRR